MAMAAQNIRYYTDKTDQIEVEFFEVTKEWASQKSDREGL